MLSTTFLFPTVADCGWQEKGALWTYFDALSKSDTKQIDKLLSPGFEYHYYKNNKLVKLDRDSELKSLMQLFKDLSTGSFELPALFAQDENDDNKFYIKLPVFFNDSPKVYTDSPFRGAFLIIDETLIIKVENEKIVRIVETKDKKRKNKLTFGFLKTLHLGNTDGANREEKNVLFYEMRDVKTRELLLIKKITDVRHKYIVETYHWPNGQKIENFQ